MTPGEDTSTVVGATESCQLGHYGGYVTSQQQQFACSETQTYRDGWNIDGLGSFCFDRPALRTALEGGWLHVFEPGYSSACLNVPEGQLFVMWIQWPGPGCPSSCETM